MVGAGALSRLIAKALLRELEDLASQRVERVACGEVDAPVAHVGL